MRSLWCEKTHASAFQWQTDPLSRPPDLTQQQKHHEVDKDDRNNKS